MTNEELFADLKQFIEATVSQQTAHLDNRIDGVEKRMDTMEATLATKDDIQQLDQKLDAVQDAIADTLTHTTETTDATLQDHEHRLQRLEHKAA